MEGLPVRTSYIRFCAVTTRTSTSWVLWFVFLAIPGSRFLRFDGIPFSSKLEFLTVALSTIAVFSPGIRQRIQNLLASCGGNTNRWVTLILTSAILLKLFTYSLLPLGNGFEACYRSIYAPIPNENECEKSYEAPFLTDDGINALGYITRMEPVINFGKTIDYELVGASATTWRLPFANDYPRLATLWLDRLPFTAKFGARIDVEKGSVIPIQFVGELLIEIGGKKYSATSYEYSALVLVPVPKGRNELRIDYKFADLDSPEIPDEPPPIRGPWAQLFVGRLLPADSALPHLTLNVRGWAINQTYKQSPMRVEIRADTGEVLASESTVTRPDVAAVFKDKRYEKSGFQLSVTDTDTVNKHHHFSVFAIYASGRKDYLGRIEPISSIRAGNGSKLSLNSVHQMMPGVDFLARYSLEPNDMDPLVSDPYLAPNDVQAIMLNLLDFVAILALISITVLALVELRRRTLKLVVLTLWFILCRWLVYHFNLSMFDSRTLVVALAVAFGICVSLWRAPSLALIGTFAGATVVAIDPVLRLLRVFGGLGSAPWWGFPVWRGRDGDWLVYQGYARQIFVEESLRGGESIFYFQPGNRYFLFVQHLLFGENDVLPAILMIVGVLVAGVFVGREALRLSPKKSTYFGVAAFICACFILFSQFDFVGFAVNAASEYPAWILTLVIFGFVLRGILSPRLATVLAIMAGLIAQFRPNQVFGACLLFLLIQFELAPRRGVEQFLTRLRLTLAFGTALSLSLFHNLHYGNSFTIFSVTGPLNSDFQYMSMFKIFNDENSREIVFDKLRLALYWTTRPHHWEVAVSFWSLQILWLLAIIKAIGTKCVQPKTWVALIAPLAYLIPLLPYQFRTYYPRHIVVIQLAFGLSALYVHRLCGPTRWNFGRKQSITTLPALESA